MKSLVNKKSKLIYITAPGHSGTTILDLLIGSIPGAFSMGEVHFLSWQLHQGAREDDPQTWCSCGSDFKTCSVYGPILDAINKKERINIFESPQKYDFSIQRRLERHKTSLLKKILNKFLSLVIKLKITKFLAFIPYLIYYKSIKRNWLLFDEVAYRTKNKYVVDSSKSFLRYWLLKMHRPEDVKLLIIKRDLKGVASSSHEGLNSAIIDKKIKSWVKFYNITLKPVRFLNKSDWRLIKYEDLCANPSKIKVEVSDFLDLVIDLKNNSDIIMPFKSHTIQGNPIRLLKKEVQIIYDKRWKKRLTADQVRKIDHIQSKTNFSF